MKNYGADINGLDIALLLGGKKERTKRENKTVIAGILLIIMTIVGMIM